MVTAWEARASMSASPPDRRTALRCYGAPMLIGAHVRAGKGLVPALQHGADIGADAVQIFTQSPRMWKPSQYGDEVLAGYRAAQAEHPSVRSTFCHATYLINLASPDSELAAKSRSCLTADIEGCPILLENAAGAGDTVGRSFEELAQVIETAGGDERLGVCLDTQHLWASGIPFGSVDEADALIVLIEGTVGMDRLRCLHLNDSKVNFGANKDRHENIGDGTIGADGLAALIGHPALQGIPAILEVPGEGDGPRTEDVATARGVLVAGLALRS
jgi:deoxyribonuclease-4